MSRERVVPYRIAVVGLEGHGKSSIVRRAVTGGFGENEHTETEQQSTAVWEDSFVYYWEFPTAALTAETAESLIVGFSGMIFAFDVSTWEAKGPGQSRTYLQRLMSSPAICHIPYVIVATKSDLIDETQELKPTQVMGVLTEGVRKTQIIMFSAIDGTGLPEIEQWIRTQAGSSSR